MKTVNIGSGAGFAGAAAATLAALLWLTVAGPGFIGYGSSLLWAGTPPGENRPFYDIRVQPGNQRVRRGGDQLVTAQLVGFQAGKVRLFARYESASKWEEVLMEPEPGASGYEFLFAAVPESVDYYVQAGAVRSQRYRLTVIDLPKVQRIQVRYHFPAWLGKEDAVENDGGDLRAVEGTEAEIEVLTDRPLDNGRLVLDDGTMIELRRETSNRARGTLRIEKDGLYHVAVAQPDAVIRLTGDYFIEAQKETPPVVRIRRPGRDYRASPIEEVTVEVEAADDFGLREMSLRYSVNAGPEKTVKLLPRAGATEDDNQTVLYLEEAELAPGDLVSLYAVARDARSTSRTDMFFIEAQPFEREYSQSQRSASMGAGGNQDRNRISPRQKEIIAATWNVLRDRGRDQQKAAEDGTPFCEKCEEARRDQQTQSDQQTQQDQVHKQQQAQPDDEGGTCCHIR